MNSVVPRRRLLSALACVIMVMGVAPLAAAHTPLLYVEDLQDGTILLEGGFSDGSSAAGVTILLLADADETDVQARDAYLTVAGAFHMEMTGAEEMPAHFLPAYYQDEEEEPRRYAGKLVLLATELTEFADLELCKPDMAYIVVLDAGPGHIIFQPGPPLTDEEREFLAE